MAETTAAPPPITAAVCTGPLAKKPAAQTPRKISSTLEHDRLGLNQQSVSTSFSEEKEAKRLWESAPWALAYPTPMAQIQRSFCAAFFKKRLLLFQA
jgi:hypothetical protein